MPEAQNVEEYKEVSSNLRHYGGLRFANLTLFAAITAGLFNGVFQSTLPSTRAIELLLKNLGLLVVAFFSISDERINEYWFALHARAKALERDLGFLQYNAMPDRRFLSSRNAVRALFIGVGLLWILSIFA